MSMRQTPTITHSLTLPHAIRIPIFTLNTQPYNRAAIIQPTHTHTQSFNRTERILRSIVFVVVVFIVIMMASSVLIFFSKIYDLFHHRCLFLICRNVMLLLGTWFVFHFYQFHVYKCIYTFSIYCIYAIRTPLFQIQKFHFLHQLRFEPNELPSMYF